MELIKISTVLYYSCMFFFIWMLTTVEYTKRARAYCFFILILGLSIEHVIYHGYLFAPSVDSNMNGSIADETPDTSGAHLHYQTIVFYLRRALILMCSISLLVSYLRYSDYTSLLYALSQQQQQVTQSNHHMLHQILQAQKDIWHRMNNHDHVYNHNEEGQTKRQPRWLHNKCSYDQRQSSSSTHDHSTENGASYDIDQDLLICHRPAAQMIDEKQTTLDKWITILKSTSSSISKSLTGSMATNQTEPPCTKASLGDTSSQIETYDKISPRTLAYEGEDDTDTDSTVTKQQDILVSPPKKTKAKERARSASLRQALLVSNPVEEVDDDETEPGLSVGFHNLQTTGTLEEVSETEDDTSRKRSFGKRSTNKV